MVPETGKAKIAGVVVSQDEQNRIAKIVNNVEGVPAIGLDKADNIVELRSARKDGTTTPGELIGEARVYSFSLEDAPYGSAATPWDLYLYDLQLFTELTLNVNVSTILL